VFQLSWDGQPGTQPADNGNRTRTVLVIRGKGAKDRVVPISDRLANSINEWGERLGHWGHGAITTSRRYLNRP